jgi:hypothetical protein
MKQSTVIKITKLLVAAIYTLVMIGLTPQYALAQTSLMDVEHAKMELSNTTHFIEQNILLALTAGVVFLGIIFACYVIKENAQSKRHQTNRNSFLTIFLLVVGVGMFCSSCGVAQQVQAESFDTAQELIQRGCPHHQGSLESVSLINTYRTIGYPMQHTVVCKYCGQRIVNTRD